jgi:signal transduction histidine kinase
MEVGTHLPGGDRRRSAGPSCGQPHRWGSVAALAGLAQRAHTRDVTDTIRWRRRGSRRDLLAALVVAGGLASFVGSVYVVVVLGGGFLLGHTSSPDVRLSILATVIIALSFERVSKGLHVWARSLVHRGRPSPYDVLSDFSKTVTGSSASEEVPPRMARALAEGTGASWAQVWLVVNGVPQPAATWPPRADTAGFVPGAHHAGVRTREVRQAGELLGMLVVREPGDFPLGPVEQRLFEGVTRQAGLALRGARLHAELVEQATVLSARAAELRRSRERLVDAHDAARRGFERDIHDGAQQHLVALAVNFRRALTLTDTAPERSDRVLAEQDRAVGAAVETLVDLSRGIYPRALTESGISSALELVAGSNPVPVILIQHPVGPLGRYAASTESSLYFCAVEALQNATKHADARLVRVDVRAEDDRLVVSVEDDGRGFDPQVAERSTGLTNLRDRIESVGGALVVESQPGHGTWVQATVPATRLPAQRDD